MIRFVYLMLLVLSLPILPLRLWWRGRKEPGYRQHIRERFGFGIERTPHPPIWIHAVSVGETRAAQPLVAALRARYPDAPLLITQMTAAGRATAEELYGARATIAYLPYDFPWAMRRFVREHRPRLAIIMETEVWPNLLRACARAGVPTLLANARLSDRSARRYRLVAGFARQVFADFAAVAAQTRADADRLKALGAPEPVVTGNLKFDVTPPADASARAAEFRAWIGARPVLLFASTRDGEEALVLDALAHHPMTGTLIAIVPRHPQRFDDVAQLARSKGRAVARRSSATAVSAQIDCWIGDSMGEMAAYYAASDVAVIGGSLLPFGAQNLIEACAAGVPVLVGPHSYNFAEAAEAAIAAGAALRVRDAGDAIDQAAALLADAARRRSMGEAGRAFCTAHRGAAARTLALCERLLRERS